MPDYYAWYTYDLMNGRQFVATVQTDEVRYAQGHRHGVRPSPQVLASLRAALVAAVTQAATQNGVPYPGTPAVEAGADLRTRSAH